MLLAIGSIIGFAALFGLLHTLSRCPSADSYWKWCDYATDCPQDCEGWNEIHCKLCGRKAFCMHSPDAIIFDY